MRTSRSSSKARARVSAATPERDRDASASAPSAPSAPVRLAQGTISSFTPRAKKAPRPEVASDVMQGLLDAPKHLPCRLLYDARGAELFEQICTVEEYYPTRTELALLEAHLPAVAAEVGPAARVIEPGSGAGQKTRMLLETLARPASYVPIDVAAEQLAENAAALRREHPGLEVSPVCGDYTAALTMPAAQAPFARTLIFFPGSTIGNFEPDDAVAFLRRFAGLAGEGGMLLLGADSNQDPETLVPAYDDAQGVTAAFDLNVLAHLNRSHRASFELSTFAHRAVWNPARSRVEMHLVSQRDQEVQVEGRSISFGRGEPIITEHCYKHSRRALEGLLGRAGWKVRRRFSDDAGRMGLWLAVRAEDFD